MNHSIHTKLDDAINRLKVYSKYPNVNLTELIEKEIEVLQDISDRLLLKELQD